MTSSGGSLFVQIDWVDLVNIPNSVINLDTTLTNLITQQNSKVSLNVFNKHNHDCRYFTKNQLKYPNAGGEVNWFNITSLTPAMSAVYYSEITADELEAITNPVTPANGGNPFATMADVEAATASVSGTPIQFPIFDATTGVSPYKSLESRQSGSIYDTYYASQGDGLTQDWSQLRYHLEYLTHRRNPYYAIPGYDADDSEINWIDEDIDGNKVWIGERQIFTGGIDGIEFRSGSWSNSRATAIGGVSGMPQISDLYNNVINSGREDAFANRQIIVYGGVEIGRNLTLLAPVSGTQTLSASGAHAYFDDLTIYGDFNYDGSISNTNGSFVVDSLTGNISTSGSLTITNKAVLRTSLEILSPGATLSYFKVDSTNITGIQDNLKIDKFNFTGGNLSITGSFNAFGTGDIHGNGDLDIDGDAFIGGKVIATDNGNFGGKLTVGGAGYVSTFESGIRADGVGKFYGGLTNPNTYSYKGFFGGDVLISGGLTIQDYFELAQDLDIHGDLTVDGNSYLNNNVTTCIESNSKFIVGQTNSAIRAGDAYFVNWTNNYNNVSTFRVYAREMGTSANILTMRMSEDNIFASGNDVGPAASNPSLDTAKYSWWDGVDPRTTAVTYKDNSPWSGLEVNTLLSQVDSHPTSGYRESQYLLFTSNQYGFSHQSKNGGFPGRNASTNSFPNGSENFGWVFSDWFRTDLENQKGFRFPLHLIASKDYVDYRMKQLSVLDSAFKVALENLTAVSDTPDINDIIIWDGSGWVADKLKLNKQLWQVKKMFATGSDLTVSTVTTNTIFVITNEGCDSSFNITLPQQQSTDEGLELVFKFLDVPEKFFPITINAYSADTIEGTTAEYKVNVPGSAIRLYVNQYHSWIVI
jgi:hypothetical protein